MRVIQIASGDLWAGAEVQLYHMVGHLARQTDTTLRVILLNYGQLEKMLSEQGIEVSVLNESELNGFQIFVRLIKIVVEFSPDIIHTHRAKENILGGLAAWITGCKSVRTVHGASEFSNAGFNFRRDFFRFLDQAAGRIFQQKIIAVSSELKEKLSKIYPVKKITVIENSIDVDYVKNRADDKINNRMLDEQFNIAFIGRFVSVKRVDLFYEIAKKFIQNNPDKGRVHFYMIGDGPLWPELNQKVIADELDEQVHLTGFVENTAPWLAKMHLLIFTSDHEGLPMTLLEAMALGVPVMSRSLATIEEVLCEGKCGKIIDSEDARDFVDQIESLVNEPKYLTSLSQISSERVLARYSINVNVNHYIDVYKNTIRA